MKQLLSVGIIAAPRPICYLGPSLDSYFIHWDVPPHIFAEPETATNFHNYSRVIWHQNTYRKTACCNWADTLKWLWENTDSEYLMICEDDIEWRPDSSVELRSILMNGGVTTEDKDIYDLSKVGFISPYCSERNQWELGARDVWTTPRKGRNWMGALTICMHRKIAERFLNHLSEFFYYAICRAKEPRYLHLDHAIGRVVVDVLKLPIITRNPTFVLHLGEYSTFECNNTSTTTHQTNRMPAL